MAVSFRAFYWLVVALLVSGCPGCSLTATDVEPDLPAGPVNGSNTVAYRLNGRPVVAHNYADVATAVILPWLSPIGLGQPVRALLLPTGTLTMSCVDAQNVVRPGFTEHFLTWQVHGFRGPGRYAAVPAATTLELRRHGGRDNPSQPGPVQPLAAAGPAIIEISEWNPTTNYVRGTFQLQFDAADTAAAASLTDGQFSLTLQAR